jgi:hypothetical protein
MMNQKVTVTVKLIEHYTRNKTSFIEKKIAGIDKITDEDTKTTEIHQRYK